jgi:hypothetical protein
MLCSNAKRQKTKEKKGKNIIYSYHIDGLSCILTQCIDNRHGSGSFTYTSDGTGVYLVRRKQHRASLLFPRQHRRFGCQLGQQYIWLRSVRHGRRCQRMETGGSFEVSTCSLLMHHGLSLNMDEKFNKRTKASDETATSPSFASQASLSS